MSGAEAAAWHRRTIRLGKSVASSGADSCSAPTDRETEAPADRFSNEQYRIRAADLGLESSQGLRVTEVLCGEGPRAALGGVVLRVAPDRGSRSGTGSSSSCGRRDPTAGAKTRCKSRVKESRDLSAGSFPGSR
jgi:hypothetical protein